MRVIQKGSDIAHRLMCDTCRSVLEYTSWATSSCWRSCPVYENDCGQVQWLASISEREIKEFLSGVITKEEADNVIHKETGSN